MINAWTDRINSGKMGFTPTQKYRESGEGTIGA